MPFIKVPLLTTSIVCLIINILTRSAYAEKKKVPLINVNNLEIVGNTIYTDKQLKKIITPLVNQKVSLEKLLQIRTEITNFYTQRGYIATGAFIPPQDLNSGKLIIRVIEGKLEAVFFKKQPFINKKYIISRLPSLKQVFNVNVLGADLQKLYNDPLIKKIKAEITQTEVGKVIVILELEENSRADLQFALSNSYAKTIGKIGGQTNSNFHVLGYGDILNFAVVKTRGLNQYISSYSWPINNTNARLKFSYVKVKSQFVQEKLNELDIRGDYNSYSFSFEQPIAINTNQELNLKIGFNLSRSESFILKDFSFSFVEGIKNGKSRISELFLEQKYTTKDSNNIIILNSKFNLGLDIFNSTITEEGRDSLYWNWELTGEKVYKINKQIVLASNIRLQFTPDQLLPSKQFSLGGNDSVRGYEKNLVIGDNGITMSNELQISLLQKEHSDLKLVTFFEGGTTWNNSEPNKKRRDLLSLGLGLQYFFDDFLTIRLDYGIPLINNDKVDQNSSGNIDVLFLVTP